MNTYTLFAARSNAARLRVMHQKKKSSMRMTARSAVMQNMDMGQKRCWKQGNKNKLLPMSRQAFFRVSEIHRQKDRDMRGFISTGALVFAVPLLLAGCATESSQSLTVAQTQSAVRAYQGVRTPISVGKFDNRSNYLRGVFSDGVDRLGSQAKTILLAHLQQTNRFNVLDRDNMAELQEEAQIEGAAQHLKGAKYVVTGDVTEFGRKETGDRQLFGVLGRGKTQTAYAKVTLNIVDVRTSEVVRSVQGAGEYQLSNREIAGFGGTASYDSTLNGKVLDLAIREAVDRLSETVDAGGLAHR